MEAKSTQNKDATSAPPPGSSISYSLLVDNEDDIVGMVAYGLYRKQKEEWAQTEDRGKDELNNYHQRITKSYVKTMRSDAQRILRDHLQKEAEVERSRITNEIRSEGFESLEKNIFSKIEERTRLKHTVLSNLIAWIITVGLTAVALVVLLLPDLQGALTKWRDLMLNGTG